MTIRRLSMMLVLFLAVALMASPRPANAASLLDEILKRGKIRVGTVLQFPPQMYLDQDGKPAGYDIVLMEMLAKDMNVELEIVDMEFDGLIPALLAKKIDLISCGLVNTPTRALSLTFSDGYVPYRQLVVVPMDRKFEKISDLNAEGIKITALLGSTAENIAKRKFPKANIIGLKQQEAMMEVTSGRADAHVAEEYLVMPLVTNNPGKIKVLNPDQPFSDEWGCYAIRPGDQRFLNYLNNWVRYYRVRGILDAIYDEIITPTFFKKNQ